MFSFFKKKRSLDWQIRFLQRILIELGSDFEEYVHQLKSNQIKSFDLQNNGILNFVAIKYYPNFFKEFEKKNADVFKVLNIQVVANLPASPLKVNLYFGYAILLGYSIENLEVSSEFDIIMIDISNIKIEKFSKNEDIKSIIKLLSKEELKYLSENDIYLVTIHNQAIYHLVDIEDGDFIGIDVENKIYKVSHDPYEMVHLVRQNLINILKEINI